MSCSVRDAQNAQDREAAEEVATSVVSTVITITAKAGTEGKLFGSITAADVVAAVKDQAGVGLDRKQVHLEEPIKEVGSHQVTVRLHADVQFPLSLEVVEG